MKHRIHYLLPLLIALCPAPSSGEPTVTRQPASPPAWTQFVESCSAAVRHKFAADPHRPGYHFLPPINYMNDPNGLIQFRGLYHLGYQWNAFTPDERGHPKSWGHAVSNDLVHWRDMPAMLNPEPMNYDMGGCWSGSAIEHDGRMLVFFSGVPPIKFGVGQCLATSDDGFLFTKSLQNPIIPDTALPPEATDVRDPYVVKIGDRWVMALGGRLKDRGPAVFAFESNDLANWAYVGPILVGHDEPHGNNWECPTLLPIDDGRFFLSVLMHPEGVLPSPLYFLGRFDNNRFVPEVESVLDAGESLFATQAFVDDRNRIIYIGWCYDFRSTAQQIKSEWTGLMSLPRVLIPTAQGPLRYAPVEELKSLRRDHQQFEDENLPATEPYIIPDVAGDMLELHAVIDPQNAGELTLDVLRSPDGAERTSIRYSAKTATLSIDRTHASLDPDARKSDQGGTLALAPGEALDLKIFVDRCVVEVFANERLCLTETVYPARRDSTSVAIQAHDSQAHLRSLDVWRIEPIWPIK
jgi:beta-fructofuranosidase